MRVRVRVRMRVRSRVRCRRRVKVRVWGRMRVVVRVRVTVDPSLPMGQRGLRWWVKWGKDSTVSPPVGNDVGGVCGNRSSPHYNGGANDSGRGGDRGPAFRRSAGRGCWTRVPIVGGRVVARDGASSRSERASEARDTR
jgi:hypothetical protein